MIGHEAKCVEPEEMLRGAFYQDGKHGFGGVWLVQIRFALIAADGDKMDALAAIEFQREAGVFAINRHTE